MIDAATGATLLATLVAPGCSIEDGARWVHGICDADMAGAPPLASVLPRLLRVTSGRAMLAYNADFDAARIAGHAARDGLDPGNVGDAGR